MYRFKKYCLSIISFILIISFFPNNTNATQIAYYSILIRDNTDFNTVLDKLSKDNQEVVYSIPEVNLIQVKGEKGKIISGIGLESIEEINPSTGEF